MNTETILTSYKLAKESYGKMGVDTETAINALASIPISIPCWQGDDVGGFEKTSQEALGGGIQATGNYPGKARNMEELMQDLENVLALVPGTHRVSLHAMYGNFKDTTVDRDQIEPQHFQGWIEWAKSMGIGLDFNATCFAHPKAGDGFTLSHPKTEIRKFWIEHVRRCRSIAVEFGKQLGTPAIHNLWIPDGSKDVSINRYMHRSLLKRSLDDIYKESHSDLYLKDAIESKLFGIGLESMTVGSHEFYLAYAVQNRKMLCLDNGHFHPTEQVGDKISSCLQFVDEILLHVTRPVRWDSDHVPILNDDVLMIAQEIVRSGALDRIHMGLDFFDASMNRIGAYVIAIRAVQLAFLLAFLEPREKLRSYELDGRYFERLALLEVLKTKPFGAVWDYWCSQEKVPIGEACIEAIIAYENEVLLNRS